MAGRVDETLAAAAPSLTEDDLAAHRGARARAVLRALASRDLARRPARGPAGAARRDPVRRRLPTERPVGQARDAPRASRGRRSCSSAESSCCAVSRWREKQRPRVRRGALARPSCSGWPRARSTWSTRWCGRARSSARWRTCSACRSRSASRASRRDAPRAHPQHDRRGSGLGLGRRWRVLQSERAPAGRRAAGHRCAHAVDRHHPSGRLRGVRRGRAGRAGRGRVPRARARRRDALHPRSHLGAAPPGRRHLRQGAWRTTSRGGGAPRRRCARPTRTSRRCTPRSGRRTSRSPASSRPSTRCSGRRRSSPGDFAAAQLYVSPSLERLLGRSLPARPACAQAAWRAAVHPDDVPVAESPATTPWRRRTGRRSTASWRTRRRRALGARPAAGQPARGRTAAGLRIAHRTSPSGGAWRRSCCAATAPPTAGSPTRSDEQRTAQPAPARRSATRVSRPGASQP